MSSILYILQTKKITDYLEEKGHKPFRYGMAGRISYLCPFPDHKETKPSFVVFTNAEYENFMCFGCNRYYNIIHLVAYLENISFKEAIKQLSKDMDLTLNENIELQLSLLDRQYKSRKQYQTVLAELLLSISSMCRIYLNSVGGKQTEIDLIEKIYADLDKNILQYKYDDIEDTYLSLSRLLILRKEKVNNAIQKQKDVRD